ncbi:membrane protein insertion efficiency factor YidD [Micromonospora sonneratiae]|uniref:Membrane protein insertion efficiency factor YidD n=1 Tax=Micromonospora sonneratiae TaxID=1184706 RepID=A0ABW3YD89_9ACTN
MGPVFKRDRDRRRKKKTKKSDACDYCDFCDPGCGDCNLGLFAALLTVGSVTARVAPVPLADRAGRAAILGYRRWLSHRWPGTCRFTPTCSAYGLAAVERYGLARGGRLAADRVRRCRPEVPRGTHDPLP